LPEKQGFVKGEGMSPEQVQKQIIQEFSQLKGWEQRCKKIIDIGKQLPELDQEFKIDDLKVKGCQSQVWIHAQLDGNKNLVFKGDSDALIVRGLVALLLEQY
jgi:cysteine desulfuration protein SufE